MLSNSHKILFSQEFSSLENFLRTIVDKLCKFHQAYNRSIDSTVIEKCIALILDVNKIDRTTNKGQIVVCYNLNTTTSKYHAAIYFERILMHSAFRGLSYNAKYCFNENR